MVYNFTNNWFNTSELRHLMGHYLHSNNTNKILEIGCYEGASACFLSDIMLNNSESELTCVDPFDVSDNNTLLTNNTKTVFYDNIKESKNYNKITVNEMYSNDFFLVNTKKYSFIYVDGSQGLEDVRNDFLNALKFIENNGIIWMNNYLSGDENNHHIKEVIDSVYETNKNKLSIVHTGYQIAFLYKE